MKQEAESILIDEICKMVHDPLGYVRFAFPWGEPGELEAEDGPDDWQVDILTALGNGLLTTGEAIQIAVASGHDIGKTALIGWIIYWSMSTCEDCRGVVTANTENQLTTKTWAELAKWHRLAINKHWFTLTATAMFRNDPVYAKTWRFDMVPWSERTTEAFAGMHNRGKRVVLLFDECSAIPDVIWDVSEGAMTDKDTELIWCVFGNPTRNQGRFKECFGRFRHRWITRQIDSRDSRHTDQKKIQSWIDDYGLDSDFVKVRVRGIFPSMSVKQFISVEDVDKAYGREVKSEQYNFAPKIITCDPAWEGDDELVIGMRQGLLYTILRVVPKNDNDMQIASMLADFEDQEEADAVFIDAGYGTGILSAGKVMRRDRWRLVWFAEKPQDKGCLNKRAEMWKKMRDWLKDGGSIPKDQVLYQDLIGPEIVPRGDDVIQLESKKDMKKRKVASPGRADALALSFAYPVQGRARERQRRETGFRFSNTDRFKKDKYDGEYQEVRT
jgi:hypothetical protein